MAGEAGADLSSLPGPALVFSRAGLQALALLSPRLSREACFAIIAIDSGGGDMLRSGKNRAS
jgi:hypothetical protein